MAARGDQLIIGIGGDFGDAAAVHSRFGEQRIVIDDAFETFFGRAAEFSGIVFI